MESEVNSLSFKVSVAERIQPTPGSLLSPQIKFQSFRVLGSPQTPLHMGRVPGRESGESKGTPSLEKRERFFPLFPSPDILPPWERKGKPGVVLFGDEVPPLFIKGRRGKGEKGFPLLGRSPTTLPTLYKWNLKVPKSTKPLLPRRRRKRKGMPKSVIC